MAVNNETGTLQDIAALSTAVKAKNSRCAVHVDAVQAWLRIPIDLKKWKNVDTLSVSGHKVHAPKGIGALFIRDSVRQTLCPPYLGGHQERGLRPGTENTPYIVGLGLAAAKGAKNLSDRNAHIRALNAQLRTGLEELAQQAPITLNSPADAVPEVLNFSTNCVNSQTFIEYLSGRHIYISGGSACDKGEPSHTLMAMGAPDLPCARRCASALRGQHPRRCAGPAGRPERRPERVAAHLKDKATPHNSALRLKHRSGSCGTASALPKCSIMSGCGTRIVLRGQKPLALCDRCPCFGSLFPPLAALTFAASSIICAFGLASAAPRSPYRHLELCGIAITLLNETITPDTKGLP